MLYKELLILYFKKNVLPLIDPSLYETQYNCFACYYSNFLLDLNNNICIFGKHNKISKKLYSCHLLPIYNPNGELLKLYDIVNNDPNLFILIYKNKNIREQLIFEFYDKFYKNFY